MHEPLISILTPFKNSAKYLTRCLESISNQTYTHWELLLIDDHSKDESWEIVKSFAANDKRITLYKNRGSGIINALRLAFKHSSGQFITRMDSDDIMAPQKLMVMAGQLQSHGPGHLALGLVKYFCEGTIGQGYATYEAWLNFLSLEGKNYSEIYKECVIPSPCWMVYRRDLIACGAFNNEIYPEDYDLAFRFYEQGLVCIPIHKVLHYWRDYESRTSRTDPNYKANHFLKLKLHYFLKLDRDFQRPLILWGAGFKGKFCAKILKKKKLPFLWICNNSKKIGKHIYNIELHAPSIIQNINRPQIIVTVANKTSQSHIRTNLENHHLIQTIDYFFFC